MGVSRGGLTGGSLVGIGYGAHVARLPIRITGVAVLWFGWGGMVPFQEVIWASYCGRRYLGGVCSAAMPFSIMWTAGAPLATSYYYDVFGDYNGAILIVAVANMLSAVLILFLKKPNQP